MKNIYAAMLQVQGRVIAVNKDGKNPHFKNKYATLESVWNALRAPLQDAGLVVMQMPGKLDGATLEITTVIAHADSGETLTSVMQIFISKSDPQGEGSAITYACRYSLMAIFGIPPVDDDGEAARQAFEKVKRPELPPGATSELISWHVANIDKVPAEYGAEAIIEWPTIQAIKDGLATGSWDQAREAWDEWGDDQKMRIFGLATTKGGVFTTKERADMKTTEFRTLGAVADVAE